MTPEPSWLDLSAMMAVLEQARVVDFVRFVNRKMYSDPTLMGLSFRDGWNVCVGEYASTYAERPA